MLILDRKQEILKLLRCKKSVKVNELSAKFYTCPSTIRRDLTDLENMGFLRRTYGGAVLLEGMETEPAFQSRESEKSNAKMQIGRLAAKLVQEGNVIAMDASTTTCSLIPHLTQLKQFTVITSGSKIASDLAENTRAQIISTGGQLRTRSLTYTGEIAITTASLFHYDYFFFSCNTINMEKGLFDVVLDEIALCHAFLANAKYNVLLVDDSKFDRPGFCSLCDFSRIDYLITNKRPSEQWRTFLMQNNVKLIF